VRLLFDENLSRKLVSRLEDLYPGSMHVAAAGLLESRAAAIWDYAKAASLMIVTTDSDFFELATTLGPPPKVIWLREWTHPTKDAESVLRNEAIRIAEFVRDPELGLLIFETD
jgi:predicted nuclease of predicted toxin-antitoxin system